MFAGTSNAGGASSTVTAKEWFVSSPELLVAEQLTVVVPIGNVESASGEQLTVTVVSLKSVAVGVSYLTAAPAALVAVAVVSAGGTKAGGASSTVTLKAVPAVICELFVTTQFTTVVPIGNVEPGAGAQAAVSVPSL